MHVHDQILEFLKNTGPTTPTKVSKEINDSSLIASAHLSDLSSQGKIRISKLKVGGSPLYYLPGQEDQLFSFAAGNVNPKDLLVLERLKSRKVLREMDLDLLSKVALRNLKDFAVPLHVRTQENAEIFWKWHLLPEEETNKLVGFILKGPEREAPKEDTKEQDSEDTEVGVRVVETTEEEVELKQPVEEVPVPKREEAEQKQLEEEKVKEEVKEKPVPAPKVEEPEVKEEVEETIKRKPKEKVEKVVEKTVDEKPTKEELKEEKPVEQSGKVTSSEPEVPEKIKETSEEKEEVKEPIKEESKEDVEKQTSLIKEDKPKTIISKIKTRVRKSRSTKPDTFVPVIETFFKDLDIEIEDHEVVRKNSEVNLLVNVTSIVGKTKYLCKAKKKSRCDEKDLSAAYMEAQIKKLPLLFLYSNEMNKKAKEMLDTGAFENVIVKKIE